MCSLSHTEPVGVTVGVAGDPGDPDVGVTVTTVSVGVRVGATVVRTGMGVGVAGLPLSFLLLS
jgi:hypothetical protein